MSKGREEKHCKKRKSSSSLNTELLNNYNTIMPLAKIKSSIEIENLTSDFEK